MAVKSTKELIELYENNSLEKVCEKIIFEGVGNKDVYNITAPFDDEGEKVIAGRVESRDSEESKVIFFVNRGNSWIPRENTREFSLQDTFVARIGGELIFGEVGGKGKIGFIKLYSLDELNADAINKAMLLENQFIDEEWGGANELHVLSDGNIGVLGHIACFDEEGNRHYYSMVFIFNPYKQKAGELNIIALRKELLPGEAKRLDIVDVLFNGGIIRKENDKAELYIGVSDAEAQKVIIKDPVIE